MDNCYSLIRCRSVCVCVTFMDGATVIPSVLFPVVICAGHGPDPGHQAEEMLGLCNDPFRHGTASWLEGHR